MEWRREVMRKAPNLVELAYLSFDPAALSFVLLPSSLPRSSLPLSLSRSLALSHAFRCHLGTHLPPNPPSSYSSCPQRSLALLLTRNHSSLSPILPPLLPHALGELIRCCCCSARACRSSPRTIRQHAPIICRPRHQQLEAQAGRWQDGWCC